MASGLTYSLSPVPFRASVKTAPFRGATWYPSHNVRGLGLLDVRGISSFTRASHFGERSCFMRKTLQCALMLAQVAIASALGNEILVFSVASTILVATMLCRSWDFAHIKLLRSGVCHQ